MGLEVTISPLLVFSLNLALVFLAQTSSSSGSLPSLPQTFPSSLKIIYNCSAIIELCSNLNLNIKRARIYQKHFAFVGRNTLRSYQL